MHNINANINSWLNFARETLWIHVFYHSSHSSMVPALMLEIHELNKQSGHCARRSTAQWQPDKGCKTMQVGQAAEV
jgi:hypothetical protein